MKVPDMLEDYPHKQIGDALYFPNLDNQAYHNGPGISSSNIRRFSQSQLHAFLEVIEPTSAMNFGSAAHYSMKGSLVSESSAYLNPDKDFPQVLDSPYEVSLYWYEQGLLCKTRADVVLNPFDMPQANNSVVLVDYKTTSDCSVRGFTNSVRRYSYDLQAAWYKRGFEAAGFQVHDFVFVAQEKKVPFANKVFKMNHTDMEVGWNYLSEYLEEYNKVLNGQQKTIYNSPNVVELDTGNFYREE